MAHIEQIYTKLNDLLAANPSLKHDRRWSDLLDDIDQLRDNGSASAVDRDQSPRIHRERLQTHEIQYRRLIENANSIIFRMDAEGIITFFNEYAQNFFGYSADEVVGQHVVGTIVPETDNAGRDLAKLINGILTNTEQYAQNENENITKKGTRVWISWTNKALRDREGRLQEILCIGHDITEHKKTEEQLRKAEENYRSIFEHAVEGIFQTTVDGRYISVNPALASIYGYDSPEELMETLTDIEHQLYVVDHRRDEFKRLIEEQDRIYNFESEIYRKDGSKIWISEQARAVRDQSGNLVRYEGSVTDITQRKRAQESLLKALEKTESLYRMVDAMATATDENAAFETILSEYLRQIDLTSGALSLANETTDRNVVQALVVDGQVTPAELESSVDHPLFRHLAQQNAPVAITNLAASPLAKEPDDILDSLSLKAILILPITLRNKLIGMIIVGSKKQGYNFSQNDIEMGQLVTDQLAIWLENRQLLSEAQYRSSLLETAAEISRAASSILDVDQLIDTSVNLIRDQFDFYYVGMFLVDNEWAVLRAGTGEAGLRQLAKNHRLKIGGESMIGWSIANRQARIALDVGEEAVHFQNPDLPDTRSEMALPLISRDRVLGALTVQSTEQGAFSDEDITLLQTMTDQLANAIANARLFENVAQAQTEAETRLQETLALQKLSKSLSSTLDLDQIFNIFFEACSDEIGFEYVLLSLVDDARQRVRGVAGMNVAESNIKRTNHPLTGKDITSDIIRTGKTEIITGWDDRFDPITFESEGHQDWLRVFTPITLRQEHIGLIEAGFNKSKNKIITDSQIRLLAAFVSQTALAIDNANRYAASQKRAKREALIKDITTKVRASTDIDTILQTTVAELGKAIKGKTYIQVSQSQPANADSSPVPTELPEDKHND